MQPYEAHTRVPVYIVQVSSGAAKNHKGCGAAIISAAVPHKAVECSCKIVLLCQGSHLYPKLLVGGQSVGVAG